MSHLYNRIKNIDAAVEKCRSLQAKHPKLWGRIYSNLSELAASFGISNRLLYDRIQAGAALSQAVLQILKEEPILYKGKEYARMTDLCAEFKMQPPNVYERLRQGHSLERALNQPIRNSERGNEVTYKGVTYSSNIELCRTFGINIGCVREQKRHTSLDLLAIFQVLIDLKKAAHIPLEENLNYIPRCRVSGHNYKSIQDFVQQFGLTDQIVSAAKTKLGSSLFDTLKSMQKKTKTVLSVDGQIKKYREMNYQQRLGAERVILPYYSKLQGVDFDTDCYDTLEIYRNLVTKAEQQMDESLEADEQNFDVQM